MDAKEYKKYHEEYMTSNTGTSFEECALLLSSIPLGVFFSLIIAPHISNSIIPIFEFSMIILPTVLNVTILSELNHVVVLNMVLLFLTIFLTNVNADGIKKLMGCHVKGGRSILTYYRAGTNFFAALCILAVDFTVFPKRFAKTESFGFGFMDLGVGFFTFSNGLVQKQGGTKNQFVKLIKSVFILFVFGVIRLLSVKSLSYHEVVAEYGVHWNFFFTLATCHLFANFTLLTTKFTNPIWLTIMTGVCHEIFLTLGLKKWVLSSIPRESFLSANREGLTSCLGFVCLYFAGMTVRKFITGSGNLTYKRLFVKLTIVCLLTGIATMICFKTIGISRRLANWGYILWVVTLSLALIMSFFFVELSVLCIQNKENSDSSINKVPSIIESINANALFFFIFSNLLTGLVNILFQTLLMGKMISVVIIASYMILLTGVTYFLYVKNIFLKL